MRREIFLYQVPLIEEVDGLRHASWRTIGEMWLTVKPMRMHLIQRGLSDATHVTHRVDIRYHAEIAAGGRFQNGTRFLDIESVEDLSGRHMRLVCLCIETGITLTGHEDLPTEAT